jgi:hypothetical protein
MPSDPLSVAASRGLFGSLANLQLPNSNAPADAPFAFGSRPLLSPDPIEFQGGEPPDGVVLVADKTKGPRNLDYFEERLFGTTPPLGSAAPRLIPPVGRVGPSPPVLLAAWSIRECMPIISSRWCSSIIERELLTLHRCEVWML